eukprot:CAMPEP_0197016702 /NCGR_PEP_ID=MMETSP1380-20130617/79112_1 /TAXON_ID=5936 /ORGANISM="Euplotes crassus, Strain CT5" /LENGTH=301 /DNA_ID=CAMNT_0042443681 /DNA_START=301 /DNA_END=1206 /DNA_ORIENTATION=+
MTRKGANSLADLANKNIRRHRVGKKKPKYKPTVIHFSSKEIPQEDGGRRKAIKGALIPLSNTSEVKKRARPMSTNKVKRIIFSQNPKSSKVTGSPGKFEIDPMSIDLSSKSCCGKLQKTFVNEPNVLSDSEGQTKFQNNPIKNWTILVGKATQNFSGPSKAELALFQFRRTKKMIIRSVEKISKLFLNYKEKQRQKQLNTKNIISNRTKSNEIQSGLETFSESSSDLSCDLSRGESDNEEDKESEDITTSRLEENQRRIILKSTKKVIAKLEIIPEASVRLEETLLKKNPRGRANSSKIAK